MKIDLIECKWCDYKKDYLKIKDYKLWTLYLSESQPLVGCLCLVLKRHIIEFEALNEKEWAELKQAEKEALAALKLLFLPDAFDVMQLGSADRHICFHVVPRYAKPRTYSKRVFADENYGKMVTWQDEASDEIFLRLLANQVKEVI